MYFLYFNSIVKIKSKDILKLGRCPLVRHHSYTTIVRYLFFFKYLSFIYIYIYIRFYCRFRSISSLASKCRSLKLVQANPATWCYWKRRPRLTSRWSYLPACRRWPTYESLTRRSAGTIITLRCYTAYRRTRRRRTRPIWTWSRRFVRLTRTRSSVTPATKLDLLWPLRR